MLVIQKARTRGFGYPFCELTPNPLEASFSPQRSWVSPFRAFLPFDDRSGRFPPSSSLLHFIIRPLGLITVLQRLTPIERAVLLLLPECLVRDGVVCSLETYDLSGFSLCTADKESISLSLFPSHAFLLPVSQRKNPASQGFSFGTARRSS